MYKLCKTEQSAKRQRQLEKGLLQVMLTTRYEDISVSDLCDRLGVPRKSFYRYFSGKDGALYALMDHTMMEFYENGLRTVDTDSAIGDLSRYFSFWYERRDLLDALQKSDLSGMLVQRATALALQEKMMPEYIRDWRRDLQQIALSFAVCGLLSMVIQWHQQGFRTPPEEMLQVARTMLTKPLIQTN